MLTQIRVQVREGNIRDSHELFPLKEHGRARKKRETKFLKVVQNPGCMGRDVVTKSGLEKS